MVSLFLGRIWCIQWRLHMQVRVVTRSLLLVKKFMYILAKKILYAKLTYCKYLNKNVEHPNLRITKIWIQQKYEHL